LTTQGDLLYRGASAAARLGIGTAGQVLKVNSGGTAPEWGAAGASGVSSVNGETGAVTLDAADVGAQAIFTTSTVDLTGGNVSLSASRAVKVTFQCSNAVTRTLTLPSANNITGDTFVLRTTGPSGATIEIYGLVNGNNTLLRTVSMTANLQYTYIWSGTSWIADQGVNTHTHNAADLTTGTVSYSRLPVGAAENTVCAGDDSRIVNILKNGASLEFDPDNGNPPLTFAGGAGGSIDLRGADAAGGNAGGAGGSIQQKGGVTGRGGNLTLNAGAPIFGLLSGRGGDIDTTGGYDGGRGGDLIMRGAEGTNAGDINTSAVGLAAGGSINTSGDSVFGYAGGSINTSGGGSINTSNAGGSINTYGGAAGAQGGSINTNGGATLFSAQGGSINTSGGDSAGGTINTSDGGGSVNTRGTGSIGLGVSGTRTTLTGTATADRAISLPNASGTIALQGAITSSGLTQATARILGRTTASTGAIEEISIGSGLSLLTGQLSATGITAVGASTADVLSVSGSDLVADDGGLINSANPAVVWDDVAGKLVYANPLARPSGAGSMFIGLAPSTTALGTNAINIQTGRSNANQVASGTEAICLGLNARATGNQSIRIGKDGLSDFDSTIAIGSAAQTSSNNAVAIGDSVSGNLRGCFFTRPFNSVYWGGQTTNATATIIGLDAGGSTVRFNIPANTALAVDILLVARRSGTQDKWLVARRFLGIRRDGSNNTALIGTVQTLGTDQSAGSPTWTFSLTADDTTEALQLEVTGAASETVEWRATAFYRVA
jgi:hypothetical protein